MMLRRLHHTLPASFESAPANLAWLQAGELDCRVQKEAVDQARQNPTFLEETWDAYQNR
jgi:hypothetical protein